MRRGNSCYIIFSNSYFDQLSHKVRTCLDGGLHFLGLGEEGPLPYSTVHSDSLLGGGTPAGLD